MTGIEADAAMGTASAAVETNFSQPFFTLRSGGGWSIPPVILHAHGLNALAMVRIAKSSFRRNELLDIWFDPVIEFTKFGTC